MTNKRLDIFPPKITLKGNKLDFSEIGYPYIDPGAIAWDAVDGDISNQIVTVNNIDTSKLGEYWVKSGTKFYSGWTYVGLDYAENIFSRHLFRRWIKGTSAEPAPAEYLTQRFIQAHARASSLSQPGRYYPRLIDRTCNPVPPDQYEAILS